MSKAKLNMKDKLILSEDLDLDVLDYEGRTFDDLYEEQGIDVLSDENISLLEVAGILDEDGYPINKVESWNGEIINNYMSLEDLWEMDADFIEMPYVKKLVLQDIYKRISTVNKDIKLKYTDSDLPQIREMSSDFLSGCFSGDVYDFFDFNYDWSISDCYYVLDDIPNEVLDLVESYGFPRNIFEQLVKGEADDESPLADWYNDLEWALISAYRDGEEIGSATAAEDDFNDTFRNSIPEGCTWIEQESNESTRPILVSKEFVENHIKEIWNMFDEGYSSNMFSLCEKYVFDLINEGLSLDFSEPYNGWSDLDVDTFADRLLDEILELKIPEKESEKQEETDLLTFDGESGEYHEDLELDVLYPDKPKKLFYKYKEYNKELSSKAYRLDYVRFSALLDFLYENPKFIDNHDLIDLEGYEVDPENVILSKVKPSYANTYNDVPAYTIWVDNGDYETVYMGWIPKQIGDEILSYGSVKEDLELDIVPVPDVEIGPEHRLSHSYDVIADIVATRYNSPGWIVQWYNLATEDYENAYFENMYDAVACFDEESKNSLITDDDMVSLIYAPTSDEDTEYGDGDSYTVAVRVGPDEAPKD